MERMLELHQQLAEAKTPTAKTMLQRQIEATDRQIDRLVYELYELTEEEIEIVEGGRGQRNAPAPSGGGGQSWLDKAWCCKYNLQAAGYRKGTIRGGAQW